MKQITLILSDQNIKAVNALKKGATIIDTKRDYSKERGKCHLTLTLEDAEISIDKLKNKLAQIEGFLDDAINQNDPVGILQYKIEKTKIKDQLSQYED
jgi:hypothetical protein